VIFAAAGELIPAALRAVRKGGSVVCAGIHMSEIPPSPTRSSGASGCCGRVANLTRADAREFLALAARTPIATTVHPYALEQARAGAR